MSNDNERPTAQTKAELVRTWVAVISLIATLATLAIVVYTNFF